MITVEPEYFLNRLLVLEIIEFHNYETEILLDLYTSPVFDVLNINRKELAEAIDKLEQNGIICKLKREDKTVERDLSLNAALALIIIKQYDLEDVVMLTLFRDPMFDILNLSRKELLDALGELEENHLTGRYL